MNKIAVALCVAVCTMSFASEKHDGEKIYKSVCKACHGEHGDKKAGGQSVQISQLPKNEIVAALKDYRSGKRSAHGMGQVMKSEMLKNSDEEIESLATYISALKKK